MRMMEFLDPKHPLLAELTGYLCGNERFAGKIREVEGAKSLAHLTVVAPTAQSARMLRLALAKEALRRGWGGVLPPKTVLPMQLVRARETGGLKEAAPAELAAAWLKFTAADTDLEAANSQLGKLDQLSDIWRTLAGGGLLMGNVTENAQAKALLDENSETARWDALAETERKFFEFLHERGLMAPAEIVHRAKTDPAPVPETIEEIILPALADPIGVMKDVLERQRAELKITVLIHADSRDAHKFDKYGRPKTEWWTGERRPILDNFGNGDIALATDTTGMARRAAEDFPAAEDEKALPALTILDETAFTETASAFLNAGYEVHNPSAYRLATSSLGRLARGLMALYRPRLQGCDWTAVKMVMRSDDTIKAMEAEGLNREAILSGIDLVQNKLLPIAMAENAKTGIEGFDEAFGRLCGWLEEARAANGITGFLRSAMKRIFGRHNLPEDAKEFVEAASCFRKALEQLESEQIRALELGNGVRELLAQRILDAATYTLEPDSSRAIKTEGWLELAWSEAEKFALVGMHEGSVPDSIAGHPFLPDSLRTALGLTDNARRLARDSWLMKELTESHAAHAVRAYVSTTTNQGDICRPSRLLYLCQEAELPKRTKYLFATHEADGRRFPRQVAEKWRLRLPKQFAADRFSPSAIDTYLRCPLTFLLRYGLKMRKLEDKRELGYDDFGTLMHAVLERYANEQLSRAEQLSDEAQIAEALSRIAAEECKVYGPAPSVNVRMQLDSLQGRIREFAKIQAKWARAGWRVAERPEYKFEARPFVGDPDLAEVVIKGTVDRIDFHPELGYRLIDYKSWDKLGEVNSKHIMAGGAKQLEFAREMGYPLPDGKRRLLTVQLMVYKLCLESAEEKFAGKVNDLCYAVLGEDAENSGEFRGAKRQPPLIDMYDFGLETAKQVIRNIRANRFWPPGPGDEWQYDFKELFVESPEKDLEGWA